jgi:hypothetical protein
MPKIRKSARTDADSPTVLHLKLQAVGRVVEWLEQLIALPDRHAIIAAIQPAADPTEFLTRRVELLKERYLSVPSITLIKDEVAVASADANVLEAYQRHLHSLQLAANSLTELPSTSAIKTVLDFVQDSSLLAALLQIFVTVRQDLIDRIEGQHSNEGPTRQALLDERDRIIREAAAEHHLQHNPAALYRKLESDPRIKALENRVRFTRHIVRDAINPQRARGGPRGRGKRRRKKPRQA